MGSIRKLTRSGIAKKEKNFATTHENLLPSTFRIKSLFLLKFDYKIAGRLGSK